MSFIINSVPMHNMNMDAHNPAMHLSLFSYLCVFTLLGVLGFCLFSNKKNEVNTKTKKIIIKGMTCSHCESNVEKYLLALKGMNSVQANYQTGEVILDGIDYDQSKIKEIIESLNYKVVSF